MLEILYIFLKMENNIQLTPIDSEQENNECNKIKLQGELNLLRWRLSQLYTIKENIEPEILQHINGMYANMKNMMILTQSTIQIDNLNFFQYIHQSIVFDYIFEEMLKLKGQVPEFYKQQAIKRTTSILLSDILAAAVIECGYILKMEDIHDYVNHYKNNPPLSSTYTRDKLNVYNKIKMRFSQYFNLQPSYF